MDVFTTLTDGGVGGQQRRQRTGHSISIYISKCIKGPEMKIDYIL